MGCFASCFHHNDDVPNIEERFTNLEIGEGSDPNSDSSLKARGEEAEESKLANLLKPKKGKSTTKDSDPLLEGPSLLGFQNLNLSGSSSSIDVELDQLENILKKNLEEEKKETSANKDENEKINDNFENVNIDLKDIHPSDNDD